MGVIAVAFVAVGLTALMPVVATPRTSPREIVLVARDMAFYLEGSDGAESDHRREGV